MDDEALELKTLKHFLAILPEEAERMSAVLEARDLASLSRLAHRLQGTASTVAAVHLEDICARLQRAAKAGTRDSLAELQLAFENEVQRLEDYLMKI